MNIAMPSIDQSKLDRGLAWAFIAMGIALVAFVIFAPDALAGNGGEEFDDVWTTLKDWTQGTLGRIIAGAMVLVGIVAGVVRQSLMAFALGIAGGMGLYQAPTIIEALLTASVTSAEQMYTVLPLTGI